MFSLEATTQKRDNIRARVCHKDAVDFADLVLNWSVAPASVSRCEQSETRLRSGGETGRGSSIQGPVDFSMWEESHPPPTTTGVALEHLAAATTSARDIGEPLFEL